MLRGYIAQITNAREPARTCIEHQLTLHNSIHVRMFCSHQLRCRMAANSLVLVSLPRPSAICARSKVSWNRRDVSSLLGLTSTCATLIRCSFGLMLLNGASTAMTCTPLSSRTCSRRLRRMKFSSSSTSLTKMAMVFCATVRSAIASCHERVTMPS